ncbi:MAG TPA: branched-chain amino acid ABC transporter ATP-binding protein/permease [Acidimicrobiales bacterium]|nr:branched-chain amino acid ABC transporter ATP-binding protein/permease [Acidimicrobiales bacterium]
MSAYAFYLATIIVYGAVDAMACLALNVEFGFSGISNFGFIIFQSVGAYVAAVLSMPAAASSNGGFQEYILGWNLPWPLPWIGAAIAGGLLALPFVFLVGKRLRGDFAAVGLLVSAVLLNVLVKNYVPLFNGDAGISLVPAPFQSIWNPQGLGYQFAYGAVAVVLTVLVYFLLKRVTESPYGRSLRAMRDNDIVADSLGKSLRRQRTSMLVLGGMVAGLSGAILVGFISLWAPGAWGYAETIVLFAAIILGGAGNHKGAILGAILVPLGFEEITRFLPPLSNPMLVPALEWVAIGLLIILFLWFRPDGILPERRRILSGENASVAEASVAPAGADSDALIKLGNIDELDFRQLLRLKDVVNDHHVILSTQGLSKAFHGVNVVSDVSISIQQGRVTGLIGPNGAGKSTTLAMLAGTLASSGGKIFYEGRDITNVPSHERAQMGLVRTFQLASEFKKLTVLENLVSAIPHQSGDSFWGAVRGKRFWGREDHENIERAKEILGGFGLSHYADTYAGSLSGGQRRLVEIMRALLAEPKVLLLDEPMAGVHPNLAHKIGDQLTRLAQGGMTILMVEHELSIMDAFCDPVIVLAEGRVLAEGTMAELRAKEEVVEAYLVG